MDADETLTTDRVSGSAGEGGSRAERGLGFQANVTAFVLAHLLAGKPLGGLDPSLDRVPVAIWAESGGPGDDIRITFEDGVVVEAQVKRGLTRGAKLWDALDALASGIQRDPAKLGLLITCPNSSRPIRTHLARDLVRIGDGRLDALSDIGRVWLDRLGSRSIPSSVCARIRIQSLSAVEVEPDAIRLAQLHLRALLADPSQSVAAWDALAADARRMIEYRGRRTLETALSALNAHGIVVRTDAQALGSASLLQRLCAWTAKTNASYSIVGIDSPLAIDTGWLEQHAQVLTDPLTEPEQFIEALQRYRGESSVERDHERKSVHAATIGQFVRLCVVLAGPGMGKTTLLTKLARLYAADGLPVLKVRLRALAERMRSTGCGLEEGLFALGCDSSGVPASAARVAGFSQWVILCDGLDECGPDRARMAADLAALEAAYPDFRIIVTSRSIGYQAGSLTDWRHYGLGALNNDKLKNSIASLLDGMGRTGADISRIADILSASPAIKTIAASPLLLGLATALALTRGSIGRTEADLYQNIFGLIEAAAVARAGDPSLSVTELTRFIDVVGQALMFGSAEPAARTLERAAERLAEDFACSAFEARRRCDLALAYWSEVGLIERIHHQGTELLAFVHKTFGEFACARFVRNEPVETQRALLRSAVALQADPVVDFAAALGLAECAFDVLLDGEESWGGDTMVRALALLNHARTEDVFGVIDRILSRSYELLLDATTNDLDRIGAGILAIAPAHRDALVRAALSHLDAESPDVRLVAWTCLLETGIEPAMREGLFGFVRELAVPAQSRAERELLLGGIRGSPPVSDLLQKFVVMLADKLLPELDPEVDDLVRALAKHPGLSTAGFVMKIEKLVDRIDRRDFLETMREHWYGGVSLPDHQIDIEAYTAASDACEIAQLSALAGDALPDPRIAALSVLPHLSAYREISDWGGTPASDVWCWQRETWRVVEREVLQAVVRLGGLDPERVAVEAASLLENREVLRGHHSFVLFRKTENIDVPAPNWRAARDLPLDRRKIEQALHHGSEFLMRLAVHLLDANVSDAERRAIVVRCLKDGTGDTLWGAAELAKGLSRGDAVALALKRLIINPGRGTEYLFNIVEHHVAVLDEQLEMVLVRCLTTKQPRVAIGAAKMIVHVGSSQALRAALFEAMDHWTANPPERPKIGDPPNVCREIALALAATAELSDTELAGLIRFRESAVHDLVAARWQDSGDFRSLLLERAKGGELSAYELSAVMEQPAPLDSGQRAAALRLAMSSDSRMRRAVIKLFGWPGFVDDESRPILLALARDPEAEIAALAEALLANDTSVVP